MFACRDIQYRGFWLVPWLESKQPEERAAVVQRTLDLMEDGTLAPAIGQTFPLSAFKDAVAASQEVGRIGKVLLRLHE